MPLKFLCKSCGKPIIVAYMKKGEKARCKNCQAEMIVPEDAVETDEQSSYLAPLPEISGKREESPLPVTESELGPRKLGKLIGDSFNIYSKNFSTVFFTYIVWQIVIQALVTALLLLSKYFNISAYPGSGFKYYIGAMVIIIMLGVFVGTISFCALTRAICAQFYGKVDIDACFRDAFSKFWRVLGAGLLVGLGLMAMGITIIGIPFAVYYAGCWTFAMEIVVIEDSKVINAFYRSKALIRGFKSSWWRVLGISMAVYLPYTILAHIISLIPYVGSFIAVFLYPVCMISTILLYLDLRVRKEGLTPALLAKDLGLSFEG